jgi:serine/threonine protein kinase
MDLHGGSPVNGPHPDAGALFAAALAGAAPPELRAHLDACEACRRLAGLSAPLAPAPPELAPLPDLELLPTVPRELYAQKTRLDQGRGGMGRVWLARDRRLGREVVIKELDAPGVTAAARAALRARLEREARITAGLQHPGIVAIYEAGRWPDGEPFYAMPRMRGEPLDEAIATRPALAARLALLPRLLAVADALAYAHAHGVIHRDVKPANVLVGDFGETQLIDWGLAKRVRGPEDGEDEGDDEARAAAPEPAGDLTQLGAGTPAYMPPEQAAGQRPDRRVDVYALGATLYCALVGRPPFSGDNPVTVMHAQAHAPVRPPSQAAGQDIPAELEAIVLRCLAKEPAARYADAGELAAALAECARALPWQPPPAPLERPVSEEPAAAEPDDPRAAGPLTVPTRQL